MASLFTMEIENYLKMILLVNEKGTEAFQKILDHHTIPKGKVPSFDDVLKNKKTTLTQCKGPAIGKPITGLQGNQLCPRRVVHTKKFDITLYFILLRNLYGLKAPTTGPTDFTSLEGSLAQIKYMRNKLSHSQEPTVSSVGFSDAFNKISDALLNINSQPSCFQQFKEWKDHVAEKIEKQGEIVEQDQKEEEMKKLQKDTVDKVKQVEANLGKQIEVSIDDQFLRSWLQAGLKQAYKVGWNEHVLQESLKNIRILETFVIDKTESNHSLPKRSIILGDAGNGKTTLCKNIASMWANGEIKGFDYCFFLKHFQSTKYINVEQVLKDYLCAEDQVLEWKIIWDFIIRHQENILIIFDGYDEYSQGIRDDPVLEVFQSKTLPDATVIVTSRCMRVNNVMKKAEKIFKLTGFDGLDQKRFINEVLNDQEMENMMNILHKIPYHEEFLSSPLFLNTLCNLTKEACVPTTMADVLDDLCYALAKHHCTKHDLPIEDQIPEEFQQAIETIGRIVYPYLAEGEVKISMKNMEENLGSDMDMVLGLGFLKEDDGGFLIPVFHCMIEYAVALWASENLDEGDIENNAHLKGVREILAGMNQQKGTTGQGDLPPQSQSTMSHLNTSVGKVWNADVGFKFPLKQIRNL